MGGFYGSIHLRSTDIQQVLEIVQGLTQSDQKFLVSPCINGWISVYPSGRVQDIILGKAIAQQFSGHVLNLNVYHEDFFSYRYYRQHQLIDEFNSDPNHFETISQVERERLRGKPEVFADLLAELDNSTAIAQIAQVLVVRPETDEETDWEQALELLQQIQSGQNPFGTNQPMEEDPFDALTQLDRFANLFGIHNAVTSYEYLQDESEAIERWNEFVHLPDPAIARAQKQREQARIDAAFEELRRNGILLVALSSPPFRKREFPANPVSMSVPSEGFLIGWRKHPPNQSFEIKHYTPPWTQEPALLGLPIDYTAHVVKVSPSGKFLVTGHGSGAWQATLYDLEQKQVLKTIPHIRAVDGIQFTPDEALLLSRSEDELILTSIETLQPIATIKTGQGGAIAVHPNGQYAVAEERGAKLAIIDLYTQAIVKVLSTASMDMAAWIERAQRGEAPSDFHPNEMIGKVDFSPNGRWLLCAMNQGIRVFEWNQVLEASHKLPLPIASASSEIIIVDERGFRMAMTYDLAFDWQRNTVLYCGLEGKVKSLDIATSESKVLLEMPGRPSILQVDLSHDLKTLCTRARPFVSARQSQSEPFLVHIWNYEALA